MSDQLLTKNGQSVPSPSTSVISPRILSLPWATIPNLTANTNDLPTPAATAVRFGATGAFDLTGIVAAGDGRQLTLVNVSANPITLKNQDVGSFPIDRFTLFGGVDRVLNADDSVNLSYDLASATWREV